MVMSNRKSWGFIVGALLLGIVLGGGGTWLLVHGSPPDIRLEFPPNPEPSARIGPSAVFAGFDHTAFLRKVTGQEMMDFDHQKGRWQGGAGRDFNGGRGHTGVGTLSVGANWTDETPTAKQVLARLEKELESALRQKGAELDPASPPNPLTSDKWGVTIHSLQRSYQVERWRSGIVRAYLVSANGGKDFLLTVDFDEW